MAFPNPILVPGQGNVRAGTTQNIDQAGNMRQMDFSRSSTLFTRNYRAAPFQVLTNAIMSHEQGFGHDYRWQNDILVTQLDTIEGTVTSAVVIINVANGSIWTPNDVAYFPGVATATTPGAEFYVQSVVGAVLTGVWVVPPTGVIADGTQVIRTGNSYQEISQIQNGPTTIPGERYNYIVDVRHAVKASKRMINGVYWKRPDKWINDLNKKGQEHFLALEKIYLFTRRGIFAGAPNVVTPAMFSRGMYHWYATNRTTLLGAALTKAAFDTFIDAVCGPNEQQEPPNWVLLCDDIITGRAISGFAAALERSVTTQHQMGMWIRNYQSPTGHMIKIVNHPLFRTHGYTSTAILFNLNKSSMAIVMGRNQATHREDAIMPFGESAKISSYNTLTTLRVSNEEIEGGVLEDYIV